MKIASLVMAGLLAGSTLLTQPAAAAEEAITFETRSGETAEAMRGSFLVPENRADPDSRMIEIGYVRFPAMTQTPGNPIVYLAGGPGGSGTATAQGRRFDLFMQMRQHGDVIAFDQRGTGLSANDMPRCRSSYGGDDLALQTDADLAADYRAAVVECGVFWREQGIDIQGYNTRESARDLAALRAHLGADRIDLWAISYGSHLALAAMNEIPDQLGRIILTGVEGLDQTVKLPARTDAYFDRLQAAVNTQPAAAAAYPDIVGMMRRVQARLEGEPLLLEIPQDDGSSAQLLVQRHHAQQMASMMIADPQNAALLLALYASLDAGDTRLLVGMLQRLHQPGQTIGLSPMSTAMDLASGVSPERRARFEAQSAEGLVGGYLNFPMPQISGVWEGHDLGEDYRQDPHGDWPVLVLTGTLDGRTYPAGQAEAVSGLSNVHIVTVENAGHNLFMSSTEVHEVMHAFMRSQEDLPDRIAVELPDFTELPF